LQVATAQYLVALSIEFLRAEEDTPASHQASQASQPTNATVAAQSQFRTIVSCCSEFLPPSRVILSCFFELLSNKYFVLDFDYFSRTSSLS
jgi:hypothetical protein